MFSESRLSPRRALAVAACALTVLAVPTGAQIRVSTQTVPLYVTVTDGAKRLVPGLLREDFEVYDNGKLQTLTNFNNEATPISVDRHARHERQHDADTRSREAGG